MKEQIIVIILNDESTINSPDDSTDQHFTDSSTE